MNHRSLVLLIAFSFLLTGAYTQVKDVTIEGTHRMIIVAGIEGMHVTSLKTKAFIESGILNSEKGTVSFWMSPFENMDKSPGPNGALVYPFLSDKFPVSAVDSSNFSIYYMGSGYPRVIARFTDGSFWGQMDYGLAPFVYAEALPLQKGQWYHIVVTWDKSAEKLFMYINGELAGHNFSAKAFKKAGSRIYIGNPLMIISRVQIQPELLSIDEVRKNYIANRPVTNQYADSVITAIVKPVQNQVQEMRLDDSWKKTFECSFTKKSDLDKWIFQTGDLYRNKFTLEINEDGLLWETPDIIHTESRGYLWCPASAEGDQCIEFEFKILSSKGLALLIMGASGMHGEDIPGDQGLRKTGSMSDMNLNYRNYHWEYIRRVEAMRTDVETQYVNKNPWGKSMYVGCVPRLPMNRWIKIRFMKTGNKLYGSIDGKTVFSVEDDPYDNNGPVLNAGRIVLRQMYHTSMKYRNFVIYERK